MGALTETQFISKQVWRCEVFMEGSDLTGGPSLVLGLFIMLTPVDGTIHVTTSLWAQTSVTLSQWQKWMVATIVKQYIYPDTLMIDPTSLLDRVIRVVGNPWQIMDAVLVDPTLRSFKVLEAKPYATSTEVMVEEVRHLYSTITQAVMVYKSLGGLNKLFPLLRSSILWVVSPSTKYTSVQSLHDVCDYEEDLADPATMLAYLADVKEVQCSWA